MNNQFPVPLPGADNTLLWANLESIEPAALDQLYKVSKLPWVEQLRVMPDVHLGQGATIGSVIAMRNAVAPAAVGVDLGCGMGAVRTNLTLADLPDDLLNIRLDIEAAVPVGYRAHNGPAAILHRNHKLAASYDKMINSFDELRADRIAERRNRAFVQCGTLGGGNHFIELCADGDGRIWLTLHSGSRNIGKTIADRHISIAKKLEHNLALPDRDLSVFLGGTPQMEAYRNDLFWAQDYALLSRRIMLATIMELLKRHFVQIKFDEPILCHHNYVAEENYDGVELIITRKGAIRAGLGDLGLIPGSMGTGSYVVRGLGNTTSLNSASHGAGRRMSRTEAKRLFTTADLEAQTAGVECRKDAGVVDEIPAAYKDINEVIAAQVALVDVVARLQTLLCVKG